MSVRSFSTFLVAALAVAARCDVAIADDGAPCRDVAILASPAAPVVRTPLRIVVAADTGSADDVVIRDPSDRVVQNERVSHAGPPWSVVTRIERPAAGTYRVERGAAACGGVVVADAPPSRADRLEGRAWASRREWSRKMEALYSAWIEHLFDAPADEEPSFPSLEPLLRDPARNFLHAHLALGEDDGPRALSATPDCADLPYLLRAYFAWKLGLPFGFRRCDQGSAAAAPRCGAAITNESVTSTGDALGAFAGFARTLVDSVHSGSARTALDDDATDFYPVPLARAAIRPGTIYADPYGHTLVVAKWIPQTAEQSGRLLAVDAQPDDTVARKRFWEGTFLFARGAGSGPGFKAFRPIVHDEAGGTARTLDDAELEDDPRFVPWSNEQAELDPDEFYARMTAVVNPLGLEPERAYETTLDALVEQLETRVRSVDNGERFLREHPGTVVSMPEGAAIFQTTGPWEDYATPSRDFRLIIAINVLEQIPSRIVAHPELYVLGERTPSAARADVERLHDARVKDRGVEYTRSDGSSWRITVADVLARKSAFETAYHPNDCVEVRWGAPEGKDERSTCRRHAPAEHRARMERYRDWFRESRRPTR